MNVGLRLFDEKSFLFSACWKQSFCIPMFIIVITIFIIPIILFILYNNIYYIYIIFDRLRIIIIW